jgi:hypothetical protein
MDSSSGLFHLTVPEDRVGLSKAYPTSEIHQVPDPVSGFFPRLKLSRYVSCCPRLPGIIQMHIQGELHCVIETSSWNKVYA